MKENARWSDSRMPILSWWEQNPSRKKRAQRYPITGIVAHYWDGGAPKERAVRDISLTGAYIHATERWYVGTILTITLQQRTTQNGTAVAPLFLSIPCKVIRQDADGGVGVKFMLGGSQERKALKGFIRDILGKEAGTQ